MAELERIKLDAEKIRAETLKIQKETKYYPYVVAGGLGGLIGALISLLIKSI